LNAGALSGENGDAECALLIGGRPKRLGGWGLVVLGGGAEPEWTACFFLNILVGLAARAFIPVYSEKSKSAIVLVTAGD
jgi:hypothetical protein